MSFDWAEYLELAEELAQEAASNALAEAKWRTAMSRAYYAVFVSARNFLQVRESFAPSNLGRVHIEVRAEYQNSPSKDRQIIGSDLAALGQWRKKADYADTIAVSLDTQVEFVLRLAHRSLKILGRL